MKDKERQKKVGWYKMQRKKHPGISDSELLKGWTKKVEDTKKAVEVANVTTATVTVLNVPAEGVTK